MACTKSSDTISTGFQTVCLQLAADLEKKNRLKLNQLIEENEQKEVNSYVHINNNDVLVTTTHTSIDTGYIILTGNIGPLPYELNIKVQINDTTANVTLYLTNPIKYDQYTYTFNLLDIKRDANSGIIYAANIVPVVGQQTAITGSINWFCAIKCGGVTILPTLIECLPALLGWPAGYVACVTRKIGLTDAAAIAVCIAQNCV